METRVETRTEAETGKEKAIEMAIIQIEKSFGKGSIMRLGAETHLPDISVIPTGCLSLDMALGVGGIPRGRVIEIFGPESSGKTTLALHAVAEAQKLGDIAAFIDAEHALDINYAKKLGVKTEDLLVSQPDYGEQALEIAEVLVRSSAIGIIVIDSVAALVPKSEIEGADPWETQQIGAQARLMSLALRKLTASIGKSLTSVIFINQTRMKIGVYGNPETTSGGQALKFYASIRIRTEKKGGDPIKAGDEIVGNRVKIKVVKNKLAPPFKEIEVDFIYNEGISKESELLDLGERHKIIEKSGAWYSFAGERIAQGREKARLALKENPELHKRIEQRLFEELGFSRTRAV